MKIYLDKIETNCKINGLGLKRSVAAEFYAALYFDTDLNMYVVIRKDDPTDSKFSGTILLERGSVAVSQVSADSLPKFQPLGTPPSYDTPSGQRKKNKNTPATSKSAIAERIEARKPQPAE